MILVVQLRVNCVKILVLCEESMLSYFAEQRNEVEIENGERVYFFYVPDLYFMLLTFPC